VRGSEEQITKGYFIVILVSVPVRPVLPTRRFYAVMTDSSNENDFSYVKILLLSSEDSVGPIKMWQNSSFSML